jgi:hypothetical protein
MCEATASHSTDENLMSFMLKGLDAEIPDSSQGLKLRIAG